MMQTDDEIQLKAWKDLAISKQMLIGAATKALGLNAECSPEDLRVALDESIKRTKEADANIIGIREQTDNELTEMKVLVAKSDEARTEAQTQATEATKTREATERQLTIGKNDNAKSLKEAKADVADKQNKLKAISKALADTPENVVKKLNTLKKQKLDDAKIRAQIESQLRSTRKDKVKFEQQVNEQKAQLEQVTPLVEQVRELHSLCNQANEKIKSLSEDNQDMVEIPNLNEELLESLGGSSSDDEEPTAETSAKG